jgi:MFS family permease
MNDDSVCETGTEPSKKIENEPVFPYLTISFLCLGMLAHSVMFTSPLPYVAFMIVDFHMTEDLDEAGYTAGWITGMFMVGRSIAGIPWGLASDYFGRQPCLFFSMLNIMVLGVVFGFSMNFYWACTVRFFLGLGNGFMGIAKTYISECCKDKDHELRAFGYLNGTWGLGMIVGPAIGGILARPALQYPSIFSQTSIWGRFPYLLPSLICSVFAAVAAVGILFYVPETFKKADAKTKKARGKNGYESLDQTVHEEVPEYIEDKKDQKQHRSNSFDAASSVEMVTLSPQTVSTLESTVETYSPLQVINDDLDVVSENDESVIKHDPNDVESQHNSPSPSTKTNNPSSSETPPTTLRELLSDTNIRSLFILYASYCFACMFSDESFPLYAVTSIQNGGLAWKAAEVGETLAAVGCGLVIFQLFFYEKMLKRFFPSDRKETLVKTLFLGALTMPLLPLFADWALRIILYVDPLADTKTNVFLYIVVVICLILYRMPSQITFIGIGMIINASVDPCMRGTVNGLMMTAGTV